MGQVNGAQRGHMVLKLPENSALKMPLFYKGGKSCQGQQKDGAEQLTGQCGNKQTPLGWATKKLGFQFLLLLCN